MEVLQNVPLAPFTTFGIGGHARYYTEVRNEGELKGALEYARTHGLSNTLMAGGSNVLIPDDGLQGLVIRYIEGEYVFSGNALRADAGCNLLKLIKAASANRYGGWEKLAGIPGSIGGAVRGNAGAFGTEIKDFVSSVRAIHRDTLEGRGFVHPYMSFSYRDSFFKQNPEWVITSVIVELLTIKTKEQTETVITETIAEREKRHLQNVKAAGSFFMNPVAPPDIVKLFETEKKMKSRGDRVPAGWLIEKAGLKGATVGGAIASLQHPNYIVNENNASAADVLALAAKIKDSVTKQFGIRLSEEAALLRN